MTNMTDEIKELTVDELTTTSSDPNIRKLARRVRIQRRISAFERKVVVDDDEIEEKTPVETQLFRTSNHIEKLRSEAVEVISNVRVASDTREAERRVAARELRQALLNKIEEENRECMVKYEEINEKWPSIFASNQPLDIHDEMMTQNAKCLEVLKQKDELIAELKQELENADHRFEEDLKNQKDDINTLLERIDRQTNVIANAYRQELVTIDSVLESERKKLLNKLAEKWENLYEKLQENCYEEIVKRREMIRDYEDEMDRVMTEHHEEFRIQKRVMELENNNLQREVQNMKALCHINVEKLNYSYAVLKLREDENTIIKNLQKRRLNKLQDTINELKKQYVELEESTKVEIKKLTDQVVKTHKNILELEEKSIHFTNINEKKYLQIWDMNIKRANEMIDRIMSADKIIYEEALGLSWRPPQQKLLNKEDLNSYQTITDAINKEKIEAYERKQMPMLYKKPITIDDINVERSLLNNILTHISKRSTYLIEDSLQELLLPHTQENKSVIRLDNVFRALNIVSEREVKFLLNFFLPYTDCPICTAEKDTLAESNASKKSDASKETSSISDVCDNSEELSEKATKLINVVRAEVLFNDSCGTKCDMSQCDKSRSISGFSNSTSDDSSTSEFPADEKYRLVCDKGHLLQIQASRVTQALKEFLERYHFIKRENMPAPLKERLLASKLTVSRNITTEDVTEFWKRYRDMFPTSKERLWDGLLVALKQYYEILKSRHQLNMDVESLRKQNSELRRLLKTYTNEPENDTAEDMKIL